MVELFLQETQFLLCQVFNNQHPHSSPNLNMVQVILLLVHCLKDGRWSTLNKENNIL